MLFSSVCLFLMYRKATGFSKSCPATLLKLLVGSRSFLVDFGGISSVQCHHLKIQMLLKVTQNGRSCCLPTSNQMVDLEDVQVVVLAQVVGVQLGWCLHCPLQQIHLDQTILWSFCWR